MISFRLNGVDVRVADEGSTLLDALREELDDRTPKDGCSPQGQCGCCTVWVDGAPRVSCVTPVRRVAGRQVTTAAGLSEETRARWSNAFVDAGASQCGFCTPGIVLRLAALEHRRERIDEAVVRNALLAHLCRCTGWQTVVEAACGALGIAGGAGDRAGVRDPLLAAWRAQIEGPAFQTSGPEVVLGAGGFADDRAPGGALVAVPDADLNYTVAARLGEARRRSGKVQGRNSTVPLCHPIELPEGDWALTLRTTWVEPAYLEPDASWCAPGTEPASPLANGGAFGGKRHSAVLEAARQLADTHGQAVRVLWPRETVVRHGPKRPPVALGLRHDGTGVLRFAAPADAGERALFVDRVRAVAPGLVAEPVFVAGPPTSTDLRGAGWVEAAVALAGLAARESPTAPVEVRGPSGGRAMVSVAADDAVHVEVWAGEVLDEVALRSYCIGAVHQALGWVWSEGIAVDDEGVVCDLTIRSFGILSARETPPVEVTIHRSDTWPVNGSDAVFAATAAAAWVASGLAPEWPTRRGGAPDSRTPAARS